MADLARLYDGLQQKYHIHASHKNRAAKVGRSLHFHIDLPQLESLTSGLGLLCSEMVISALPPLGLGIDRAGSESDFLWLGGTFQLCFGARY